MALKVELKAGERFILGNCLITNSAQRIQLLIEGDTTPILREKDIMTAKQANTPAKRFYFAIQLMYTGGDPIPYHETYFVLMRDLLQAAPSTWPHILTIIIFLSVRCIRRSKAPKPSLPTKRRLSLM